MKPAPFEYLRPLSLDHVLELIAAPDHDAKLLAGGQTLVPVLNFRLARPSLIIDINRVPGLDRIDAVNNELRLGALVRWRDIQRSPVVARTNPLLIEAVSHVAHYQIRNRGTIGGSCAHADPAAEFPAAAVLCGAEFILRRRSARRAVTAKDFFRGALTTALEPDEILTEIRFPHWPAERTFAFEELAPRQGDFALAGAAGFIDWDAAGYCKSAGLVSFGATDRPHRLAAAEAWLVGRKLEAETIATAAAKATQSLDALSDIHASAEYRRSVSRVLIERVLARAAGAKAA
jgi:carbon-monoxide dehydrogenase medium subunit